MPIRCAPDPGEALDSWLEFTAARLTCPFTDVLGAFGLPNRETAMSALVLPAWTIRLTRDELASITEVTGVAAGVLAAMTLQPFDGHAVDILPRHRRVTGGCCGDGRDPGSAPSAWPTAADAGWWPGV
ncbi:TniQ family protein [Streptomyces hawaiiensis]|uniref:TniQ family protein n=1 Tax=Streptomyces hawaiiensis TaxID=67305 RepID=UPI001FE7725E|nr:TniQ family protein [Streptomyces hawaiiensis]